MIGRPVSPIKRHHTFSPTAVLSEVLRIGVEGGFVSPTNTSGVAHAVFDAVVTGTSTRQTWFTTRLRGRSYHPSRPCSVERGASRDARHVRGRLSEVIPLYQRSNLRILSHKKVGKLNVGERDTSAAAMRQVGLVQSGCAVLREHRKSPGGNRTKATMANRVKSSTGSFNARWRREPGGGNTDPPEADNLRGSAEKSRPRKAQR